MPKVVVVLTDGYIDQPPEPSFSVIWCVIGRSDGFDDALRRRGVREG